MTADRIERAARAMYESSDNDGITWDGTDRLVRQAFRKQASAALTAAFPDLMADPPSHWIAPMEATEGMIVSGICADQSASDTKGARMLVAAIYRHLRDAHLKEQGE